MARKKYRTTMDPSSQSHSYLHLASIIVALVVFIIALIFNALAGYNHSGLFIGPGIANLSRKYDTDITPTGGTFSIWAIIYIWQAIWLTYAVVSIGRQGAEGPLYRSPILLPAFFFAIYIVANSFNIAWLFLWDRQHLTAAFIVLLGLVIALYACIGISMAYLTRNLEFLNKNALSSERWWIWIAVQNGLAIYATWATVAAVLNLAIVLQYGSGVSRITAGTIGLSIVLGVFLFWSIMELIFLDAYARYLFMPYLTLIWVFIGILVYHYNVDWTPSYRNAIIAIVGIIFVLVMTIIKFVFMFYRTFTKSPLK